MTDREALDLETMFEAARAAPPEMPPTLITRVLADAVAHQPRAPLWRRIVRGVGGPVGVGGLLTGMLAGAWIGFAPPVDGLDPLTWLDGAGLLSEDRELAGLYAFGWDMEEG